MHCRWIRAKRPYKLADVLVEASGVLEDDALRLRVSDVDGAAGEGPFNRCKRYENDEHPRDF